MKFEEYLDTIDAFIFTGDTLHLKQNREVLKEYMKRWERALNEDWGGDDYDDIDFEDLTVLRVWPLVAAQLIEKSPFYGYLYAVKDRKLIPVKKMNPIEMNAAKHEISTRTTMLSESDPIWEKFGEE